MPGQQTQTQSPDPPAVFFDAVGTLVHVSEAVGETYARIGADFGFLLDPDEADAAFRRAFAEMPDAHAAGAAATERGEDRERRWWRDLVWRVYSTTGIPSKGDFEACFETLFAHYSDASAWLLFPDVRPALERLRAAGMAVGILSNFDRRLAAALGGLGIADCFCQVVISAEVGASKPDPAIFAAAARAMGRPASACLHIGDDADRDYRGALDAGFGGAFLVDRRNGRDLGAAADWAMAQGGRR
ncbi:MAG: HAD-IA family hydrolase [Verrucomicrobiales bacterium]